jgi:hypothetical protein
MAGERSGIKASFPLTAEGHTRSANMNEMVSCFSARARAGTAFQCCVCSSIDCR